MGGAGRFVLPALFIVFCAGIQMWGNEVKYDNGSYNHPRMLIMERTAPGGLTFLLIRFLIIIVVSGRDKIHRKVQIICVDLMEEGILDLCLWNHMLRRKQLKQIHIPADSKKY